YMDKSIYDTVGSNTKKPADENEKTLPPTEEPIDKNIVILNEEKNTTQEQSETEVKDSVLIIEEQEYIIPVVKPEVSQKIIQQTTTNEDKFYKIQIAAMRTQANAEKEWSNLSKRFPKILKNFEHYVTSKDIEGKGVFYRLQIGPFKTEAEANKTCKLLKNSNINCFIVKPN
ncbi:MAG: SPOR domain-containing protein, partial [Pseudomonadota bacterium]